MQNVIGNVIDVIRASAIARRLTVRRLRADIRQARVSQRRVMAGHRVMRRAVARAVRRTLRQHRRAVIASLGSQGNVPSRSVSQEPLQAQVLRVIESHPEGLRAVDVGNALGVDWRGVLEAARNLVDAGAVEQVGQELYPAKASRR